MWSISNKEVKVRRGTGYKGELSRDMYRPVKNLPNSVNCHRRFLKLSSKLIVHFCMGGRGLTTSKRCSTSSPSPHPTFTIQSTVTTDLGGSPPKSLRRVHNLRGCHGEGNNQKKALDHHLRTLPSQVSQLSPAIWGVHNLKKALDLVAVPALDREHELLVQEGS